MAKVKITVDVAQPDWETLQQLARENGQTVSAVLTQAVAEYVRNRGPRENVMSHLDKSIEANEELGQLLAR